MIRFALDSHFHLFNLDLYINRARIKSWEIFKEEKRDDVPKKSLAAKNYKLNFYSNL